MSKKTALKNTVGITVGSFGQNIFISLTSMALSMYFTDVLYIAPALVSIIFLISRIWDAVNDPIMGMIVDKTHTKWGKCRPFMLYSAIPLTIFTILMFSPIGQGKPSGLKFSYYLTTYLLFITSYTALDIPMSGIKPLLFTDPNTRNKAMAISSTFGSMGSLFAIDLFLIFVEALGGDNLQKGYFITVLLLSLVGFATLLNGFFSVKEVIPVKKTNTNLFESIKIVAKNKPMLLTIIASFVSVGISAYSILLPYFSKWNLADTFSFGTYSVAAVMLPILSTATGIIYMVAIFITPYVLKFVSKKKLFLIVSIYGVIVNAVSYFCGYENFVLFVVLRCFAHIAPTMSSTILGFMFADTLDYAELKDGVRTEGMSYAFNNLVNKCGNAVFSAAALAILGVFGYAANVAQPALDIGESINYNFKEMLDGIFMLMTALPGISLALQIIPMVFYKFNEKEHSEVLEKLKVQRAEMQKAEGEAVACEG